MTKLRIFNKEEDHTVTLFVVLRDPSSITNITSLFSSCSDATYDAFIQTRLHQDIRFLYEFDSIVDKCEHVIHTYSLCYLPVLLR